MQIKKGTTDVTLYFHLRASADGTSKTSLVHNSAGAIASYVRTRGTRTAISLVTLAAADSAHSDGGFKEVDGTNAKGLYRFDVPNAAFASGVDEVIIHIGFTDVFEESLAVELVDERPGNLAASQEVQLNAQGILDVNAEVDSALADIKLDHLIAVADGDDPVNDSIIAKLAASDGDWSGFDKAADALEAIRDRGDSAWITGAGASAADIADAVWDELQSGHTDSGSFGRYLDGPTGDRLLLLSTTIATLASQTSFTLTAGSADDDAYNNCTIVIEDASTATQKAVGIISNYVGVSKTITLLYDPAVFTMATTDKVYILAENALKATMPNRQIDVASDGSIHPTVFAIANQIWDELQSGHTDSGSFGRYLDTAITTIAAAIGSGLLSCTWTQKDDEGNPMDNVQIWITTDEGGSNVVAGALYTNTAGEVTFMLDAGTYYVWREKGGFNFTNPQTWTVS